MALPSNFLDELRARTPIAAVIGRTVKLTRSGRQHKGCCPFHGEKTPSFYVYDEDFHCFGCGAHGDVITFVMKTTGAGFMEAVEELSRQAGLSVPQASPREAEVAQKRAGISEVLEAAGKLYQKWLFEPEGRPALAYLRGRGLTDETIKRFGLGWSGEGRGQLAGGLRGQGIKPDQLIEAGLMKLADHGPVDMFFSRVMFPIRDRRGAMISFGGRIMGDGQPKYVNGPETAVFSKRRSLYGLNLARDAVRKGAPLIVVEGYMDVIALAQAGFGGAVAPLGTALTEDHLAEIWRLTPEPVICFDADNAGRRAALKTVDLALTALAPDRSLKFLRLPEKDDPDSFIRREGAKAFESRLATAQVISTALYGMLAEGKARTTPEGRAMFRHRLIEVAGRIPDKILASEYRDMLLERFFDERRSARESRFKRTNGTKQYDAYQRIPPTSDRPDYYSDTAENFRGIIETALMIEWPELVTVVEEEYSGSLLSSSCIPIRDALMDFSGLEISYTRDNFYEHLQGLGLADDARLIVAVGAAQYRPSVEMPLQEVLEAWKHFHELRLLSLSRLEEQKEELRVLCSDSADPVLWDRYKKVCQAVWQAKFAKGTDEL